MNQCLSMAGVPLLPIADAQIKTLVTNGWTVTAALWVWWKNNTFTQAAIRAGRTKDTLKKEVS